MVKPKLTHHKRPMLFYQDGTGDQRFIDGPRIRIVFPDGRSMWKSYVCAEKHVWRRHCYDTDSVFDPQFGDWFSIFPSAKHAIEEMRKYDRDEGYEPADFLGYL